MSWDIMLFNSPDAVDDFDDINIDKLEPIDFNDIFHRHFNDIKKDKNHRSIVGHDFNIEYFADEEMTSNILLSLYGESALFEIIHLAKKYGWQIFDTGNGEMIDLDDPANNGYDDFTEYVSTILK